MKTTVKDKRGTRTYEGGKETSSTPKSSSSKSSSSSKDNSTPNVTQVPGGYAYLDKYGYGHVVKDYDTAAKYAKGGTDIYNYGGNYSGGYARDSDGMRMPLPLPGAVPYGNDLKNNTGYQSIMPRSEFDSLYKGALGGVASKPSLIPNMPTMGNTNSPIPVPGATRVASLTPSLIPPVSAASNKPSLIPNLPAAQATGGTSLAQFGGQDAYAASQGNRYRSAYQAGDMDLMRRLEADSMRVGYNLPSLIPQAPTAVAGAQDSVYNMPLYPIMPAPEYDVYRPRKFDADRDWEAPDVGGSGITWMPTNTAIEQFNQSEQDKYNVSLNEYNSQRQNWQDLNNVQWQQYQEKQRQTENQQATQSAAKQAAYEQAFNRWATAGRVMSDADAAILGVPKGTRTNDAEYRDASLAIDQMQAARSGSSGGGGSSGGLTANQLFNAQGQQVLNALSPYMMQYKSYNDLLADLPRIASYLPASVTLQDLQKMAEGMKSVYFDQYDMPITPKDFIPNSNQQYGGSPLFAGLGALGIYGNQGGGQSQQSDSTQQKINQARANGASDAQIRAALVEDGIDPKKYGL